MSLSARFRLLSDWILNAHHGNSEIAPFRLQDEF